MTGGMEHCDEKGMEHCETSLMEHCVESGLGALW